MPNIWTLLQMFEQKKPHVATNNSKLYTSLPTNNNIYLIINHKVIHTKYAQRSKMKYHNCIPLRKYSQQKHNCWSDKTTDIIWWKVYIQIVGSRLLCWSGKKYSNSITVLNYHQLGQEIINIINSNKPNCCQLAKKKQRIILLYCVYLINDIKSVWSVARGNRDVSLKRSYPIGN